MTRCKTEAGVCGFSADITAESSDGQHVQLSMTSDCPQVRSFISKLNENGPIDALQTVFATYDQNLIFQLAAEAKLHPACPVPIAVLKAVESSSSLALPADVKITISNE